MSESVPTCPNEACIPERQIAITQDLIDGYAEISKDFNPIHVDRAVAAASVFGGTIAHGCIPLEPVFQAIQSWLGADQLPPGSKLRLRYRAPSRPGDMITASVAPKPSPAGDISATRTLGFSCRNQNAQTVMDGECDIPI